MNSSRRYFLKSSGSLLICFSLPGCSGDRGRSGGGYASIDSRIRVESSGIVNLSLGKVELGQGIGTALAQIAAEELGVDIDRIRLSAVDTDYSPDESYTFSTISVQQSGPLVRRAAAAGRPPLQGQWSPWRERARTPVSEYWTRAGAPPYKPPAEPALQGSQRPRFLLHEPPHQHPNHEAEHEQANHEERQPLSFILELETHLPPPTERCNPLRPRPGGTRRRSCRVRR